MREPLSNPLPRNLAKTNLWLLWTKLSSQGTRTQLRGPGLNSGDLDSVRGQGLNSGDPTQAPAGAQTDCVAWNKAPTCADPIAQTPSLYSDV